MLSFVSAAPPWTLVALPGGQEPPGGELTAPTLGIIRGALTALGIGLALRSLVRQPQWVARAVSLPRWRRASSGAFAPGLMLLGLPQLLAAGSGRFFGYVMMLRDAGHHDLAGGLRRAGCAQWRGASGHPGRSGRPNPRPGYRTF